MSDIEIITFGCRLNAYESEVMRQHADAAGLSDAVIVSLLAPARARLPKPSLR